MENKTRNITLPVALYYKKGEGTLRLYCERCNNKIELTPSYEDFDYQAVVEYWIGDVLAEAIAEGWEERKYGVWMCDKCIAEGA